MQLYYVREKTDNYHNSMAEGFIMSVKGWNLCSF